MAVLTIHRGRTETFKISLSYDVSDSVLTSQIRRGIDVNSVLIAEFDVQFETDGKDGNLLLIIDDSVSAPITDVIGYMDIKRLVYGEPLSVLDFPIQVEFVGVVTA